MDDHDKTALEILVESLKLYVTLSTLFMGALLTYYYGVKPQTHLWVLILSVALFFLSALASVVNVNVLVGLVHDKNCNIREPWSRWTNIVAIVTFCFGIFTAGCFLYFSRVGTTASPSVTTANGIEIKGDSVMIGPDAKTKVLILHDSAGRISEIKINQP